MSESLLRVDALKVWFSLQGSLFSQLFKKDKHLKAVDGVSFDMDRGEILGLAGESGCGKSTTAFTILRLYEPTEGQIFFEGSPLSSIRARQAQAFRRKVQIIFQDPYQSLNPRFTVIDSVSEPLVIHGVQDRTEKRERALAALRAAGLLPPEAFTSRFPHELSGGQRQRVAIARAIVLNPALLVADEPVSMLDVSVRAGILNLLKRFAREMNVTILYISHDLGTIRYICDRAAIMYLGRIVETGRAEEVITRPLHPYTRALVDSVPEANPNIIRPGPELLGRFIEEKRPELGCPFQPRCPKRADLCQKEKPELVKLTETHGVACHLYR